MGEPVQKVIFRVGLPPCAVQSGNDTVIEPLFDALAIVPKWTRARCVDWSSGHQWMRVIDGRLVLVERLGADCLPTQRLFTGLP